VSAEDAGRNPVPEGDPEYMPYDSDSRPEGSNGSGRVPSARCIAAVIRCWMAGLPVIAALVGCSPPEGSLGSTNTVLLISIDTLRADALSSYGNPRPTTPHLDALARDGVRFTAAIAPSPWTIPSHASILTGFEPGVVRATEKRPVAEALTTLPELLRDRGFATGAVVNFQYLDRKHGFAQGFDEFEFVRGKRAAPRTIGIAADFLRRHRGRPQFFFLHRYDVHGPYDHPAPYAARYVGRAETQSDGNIPFLERVHYADYLTGPKKVPSIAYLRAKYDGGVAKVDAQLGRLFETLKRLKLYDEMLIVVTADHGEAFFEHRVWVGHGLFLYEPELHIPLIVKPPTKLGIAGAVVEDPVSLVDILPTILEVTGHPYPGGIQGTSLLARLRDPQPAVGEDGDEDLGTAPAVFGRSSNLGGMRFVRTRRWKYIEAARTSPANLYRDHLRPDAQIVPLLNERILFGPQLYDLAEDPGEMRNLATARPDQVEKLQQRLRDRETQNLRRRAAFIGDTVPDEIELTREEREQLRAMGYAE